MKQSMVRMMSACVLAALAVSAVSAQEVTTAIIPVYSDPVEAAGTVLVLTGHVLDANGDPVEGARVEIWQTDDNSVYAHPNVDATNIDANFQHFGAYVTDADGFYTFRTVVPKEEGIGRPLHIHVKVFVDDAEVLTTQFYFAGDDSAASDQWFAQAGDAASLMILEPAEVTDTNGLTFQLAAKDIIVSLGAAGTLTLTPEQTEGPYYPVATVADFDNDLTVVSEQANPANAAVSSEAEAVVAFTLLNLNTASGDDFSATIPNFPSRMVREFLEYRPYVSIQQFRREISKYVGDTQTAEWEQYVYVPIDVNNADAATLMQIPGVDEAAANALIATRPFASNDAFLAALGSTLSAAQVQYAANYLSQ